VIRVVMPGLVPGIHDSEPKRVDGRDKPGHDEAQERIGRAKKAAEILVFAGLGA
jgi:hypothetical protein